MNAKRMVVFALIFQIMAATPLLAQMEKKTDGMAKGDTIQSLITKTPEEGFHLAIKLARKGVTTTQPDKSVLHMQREVYSRDANSLIAASHVIATYFATIAAANNYWR
ncbi:MAG: hexameric tyrosine-coordinated heme protein [Syntrophotaleaceae bacterium]